MVFGRDVTFFARARGRARGSWVATKPLNPTARRQPILYNQNSRIVVQPAKAVNVRWQFCACVYLHQYRTVNPLSEFGTPLAAPHPNAEKHLHASLTRVPSYPPSAGQKEQRINRCWTARPASLLACGPVPDKPVCDGFVARVLWHQLRDAIQADHCCDCRRRHAAAAMQGCTLAAQSKQITPGPSSGSPRTSFSPSSMRSASEGSAAAAAAAAGGQGAGDRNR